MRRRRPIARGAVDWSRLRSAMASPGMDPRAWACTARIDDDPDAVQWHATLGWLCDLTVVSGPLAGQPIPLACSPARDSHDAHHPPARGRLVSILLPTGDPNDGAVVTGYLNSTDEDPAPTTINGDRIVETNAGAGEVAADVTHVYSWSGEDVDIEARHVRVTASDRMVLGTAQADQPYVRGTDLADALGSLLDALSTFAAAIAVAPVAGAVVALDQGTLATFQQAIATAKQARQTYLSQRITGD